MSVQKMLPVFNGLICKTFFIRKIKYWYLPKLFQELLALKSDIQRVITFSPFS